MGIFDKLKGMMGPKNQPVQYQTVASVPPLRPAQPVLEKMEFRVAGINYYAQNIQKLQIANPDWRKSAKTLLEAGMANKRIFHYNYESYPVALIPEPDNPYDPNAIKVVVKGQMIGHIAAQDCLTVQQILFSNIQYVRAHIIGGEYKVIMADGTIKKNADRNAAFIKIGFVRR